MASTNKTAHLALNQWVLSDPLLMEDVNEDNRKLDAGVQKLQAQLDAQPYVKLLDITTKANAKQVDLDISGIDFSKYAIVQLFSDALSVPQNSSDYTYVRINNEGAYSVETMYNYSACYSKKDYVALVDAPQVGSCVIRMDISGLIRINPEGVGPLLIRSMGASVGRNKSVSARYGHKYINKLSELKSINFLTDAAGVSISAGSRFVMYGVKL